MMSFKDTAIVPMFLVDANDRIERKNPEAFVISFAAN
jgi:hypothetical protein